MIGLRKFNIFYIIVLYRKMIILRQQYLPCYGAYPVEWEYIQYVEYDMSLGR